MEEFEIIPPSISLAPYIKLYWFLKRDGNLASQRIIPTGNVGLFFNRGDKLFSLSKGELLPKAFLSGQSMNYSDIQVQSTDMISITFQPHGAKAFFDIPINRLFESTIPIGDLGNQALNELQSQLMEAPNIPSCVKLIETFFIKQLMVIKVYNHQRMNAVINSINAGQMNIENLAQTSCLSYKQFKRVFSEYIGTNPKDFLRTVRFQKALYTLQLYPQISFTQLAFECGYYDQPHFIKEFKMFSGYTPKEYIASYVPYSDYFT